MAEHPEMVFIVDDDESVRRGLKRLLRSAGFNVETFDGAASYLQRAEFVGIGCIVLDLAMPGCTGMELQRRLIDLEYNLPIVFLTGHGDIPASVQAMKRGAVDFLIKPVDENALLAAINAALALQRKAQARRVEQMEARARFDTLTPRELEVLRCVISGALNKQIAAHLHIAEKTVKVHRGRAMAKLKIHSTAEAVHFCGELGIEPEPKL